MAALHRRIALVAMGGLIVCTGCGAKPMSSKSELARRANAICARYKAVYRGGLAPKSNADVLRYLDRTKPFQKREESELRVLQVPKKQRPAVERLLGHAHHGQDLLNSLRAATAAHDGNRQIELLRQLGDNARRTIKEARALGWTVCASPPNS
jgi:hypothetical protein